MVGAAVAGTGHAPSGRRTTVVHLITTLSQGGAERVLSQVVPRPGEHPDERHVVVSLVDGGMFADELATAGVEVRGLGMRPGRDVVRGTLRLARTLRELRPSMVVSWMYHASLLDLLARPFAGPGRRARMVWMVRGSLHTGLRRDSGLPLHTRVTIRLLSLFSRRPEAIVTNSRAGRSHHGRAGYRPRRWVLLPNGCDIDRSRPDASGRAAVREALGIPSSALVAITVARVHPQKDHPTLLAALHSVCATHPELECVLVGTGTEALTSLSPGALRVHGLGERTDVARLLRAADLVISSSLTEGLPNALLEAMASGVVPVATDVGDCRRVIGATGAIVDPRDSAALATVIGRLLATPADERAVLGTRARERVAEHFAIGTARLEYRALWDRDAASRLVTEPRDSGPVRVVHVIARMNVGGPASILAGMLDTLDPEQFPQTLVTGSVGTGEQDWFHVRDDASMDDARIIRIAGLGRAISPVQDLMSLRRLTRLLITLDPDIVQTHTAKAGLLGRRAARRAGVPHIIHTFHGHTLHGYFSAPVTAFFTALERRLARRTHDLIAVGTRVRDELLDAGIGVADQYTVIPPGVPDEEIGDRATARAQLGLPITGLGIVAFVGRLSRVKRPDRFLAAAEEVTAHHPNTIFLVVGDGEERALLEQQERRADVRFLGWRGDVSRIHAATDLIVVTSDNEGMPVTLIEAAMAGRACVTTDVGSAAEVVLDGETGLVVPPDASAVARAISALLDDPELMATMGATGRIHAMSTFGTTTVNERLAAVYRRGPRLTQR